MKERVEEARTLAAMTAVSLGVLFGIFALGAVLTTILHPSFNSAVLALSFFAVALWTVWAGRLLKRAKNAKQAWIDLDASKRREDAEHERILTLINNLSDAVLSVNSTGIITLYNASCLGLLDTNKALDGMKLNDAFKLVDETGKQAHLFNRIRKAKSVTVDDTLRMKQGEDVIRLEFTYAPIRGSFRAEQGNEGYMIIARDVTRLKSLEEERDEFISVVSHELRTPITVTEGTISNVQLMMDRGMTDLDTMKKSLAEAHEQVLYLARMINDLSTLSRAERGVSAEAEVIDVESLAHELYSEYSPEAEKQGLHLDLSLGHDLGTVKTSRLYIHELLQNFITNGIKYTKEGSVKLTVTAEDGMILFEVSDTGIGISKSDQAKVFQKFFRSEDYRTRETGGTGLGLYVADKLSRKIHTTIELKSRLNHGSTFSFKLPKAS